jgi:hypothetical protein
LTYRDEPRNASRPTITGKWKLSPTNAHIAVDNIVIMRKSATTTIPMSAVITITPTPAISSEEIMRHIKALPVNQEDPPPRMYNGTICNESTMFDMAKSIGCIPVFAELGESHTQEDFISWLVQFGWQGPGANASINAIRYQKAV